MIDSVLSSLGGLGMFLLGMVLLTDGLRAMTGRTLRRVLRRGTRSPATGALTGALSTAVIQSSSATTVAAVGFVGAGLLTFPQALGVIFGANVGTTVTGWLVALFGFKWKLGQLVLPLLLFAVLLRMFGPRRMTQAAIALSGFCVVFIGIDLLQEGMGGLADAIDPASLPGVGWVGRLWLVLIGAALTIVTQSSSAGVALALVALHSGTIGFSQAAALVIGMNIGTTVTAILATVGTSTSARRTGFAHLIYNAITAVVAFLILPGFIATCGILLPGFIEREPELGLVAFHTFFNLMGTLMLLPFTAWFARLVARLVPSEGGLTEALDRRWLQQPSRAIEAVGVTLVAVTRRSFRLLARLLEEQGQVSIRREIDEVEAALTEVREYLAELPAGGRVDAVERPYAASMHTIDHLGRLQVRSRRRRSLEDGRVGPQLAEVRVRLARSLESWDAPGMTWGEAEAIWEDHWRHLDEGSEKQRKDVLRRTASGELGIEEADAQLAAYRWLRRTTEHVWRIVHHLQRTGLGETRGAGGSDQVHEQRSTNPVVDRTPKD